MIHAGRNQIRNRRTLRAGVIPAISPEQPLLEDLRSLRDTALSQADGLDSMGGDVRTKRGHLDTMDLRVQDRCICTTLQHM